MEKKRRKIIRGKNQHESQMAMEIHEVSTLRGITFQKLKCTCNISHVHNWLPSFTSVKFATKYCKKILEMHITFIFPWAISSSESPPFLLASIIVQVDTKKMSSHPN